VFNGLAQPLEPRRVQVQVARFESGARAALVRSEVARHQRARDAIMRLPRLVLACVALLA